jgi:hypothetical protein
VSGRRHASAALPSVNSNNNNNNSNNNNNNNNNVIEHRKSDRESNNTGFGKVENNKHPSTEGELHTGIS